MIDSLRRLIQAILGCPDDDGEQRATENSASHGASEYSFEVDDRTVIVSVQMESADAASAGVVATDIFELAIDRDVEFRHRLIDDCLSIQQILHPELSLDADKLFDATHLVYIQAMGGPTWLFYVAEGCERMQISLDESGAIVGGGVN